jgi:hypothetical protein
MFCAIDKRSGFAYDIYGVDRRNPGTPFDVTEFLVFADGLFKWECSDWFEELDESVEH